MLLTLLDTPDAAWADSPMLAKASRFELPRLRAARGAAVLPGAMAFLAVALWLPQQVPSYAADAALADDIAADLKAVVAELKREDVITPAEEEKLDEQIEQIRRDAQKRVDSSSWEAADALRERMAAGLSEKQDAVKWAEESLGRYAAAAQSGASGESSAEAQAAELTEALEKLAQSGLLAGAPAHLQGLLKGGKLPADAKALGELTASLARYLENMDGRLGKLADLGGTAFGRFDPSEFPLASDGSGPDGDGNPGRGGVNRGRADAGQLWGNETLPFDRFTPAVLPPGAPRSPDDWAPVVVLPGTPQEAARLSAPSRAREYAAGAGQTAWRRTLTPRHQSAVKKYFER